MLVPEVHRVRRKEDTINRLVLIAEMGGKKLEEAKL